LKLRADITKDGKKTNIGGEWVVMFILPIEDFGQDIQIYSTKGECKMNRGCCNECGYKADYITDYNNYESKGYKNFDEVPKDKMLCGTCYEESAEWKNLKLNSKR